MIRTRSPFAALLFSLAACSQPVPEDEVPSCGNGILEGAERCDDGAANSDTEPDACRTDCQPASCGDGVLDDGEVCDDGDTRPSGACLTNCVPATCGDLQVWAGVEECDDGNAITEVCSYGEHDCTVCDAGCSSIPGDAAFCGDAVRNRFEGCDDGNPDDLDACNNECTVYHDEAWSFIVASGFSPGHSARSIAVDTYGDLLIAGVLTGFGATYSAFVTKRATDGTASWEHSYLLVEGADAGDFDVAAGPDGEAGFAAGGAVRKYDTAGALLWEDAYQGRDPPFTALALCATETGALLVSGFARPVGLDLDAAAFRRYEPDGEIAWTTTLWGETEVAWASAIACLPGGGFVAAGARHAVDELNVAWVGRFDANGQAVWTEDRAGLPIEYLDIDSLAYVSDDTSATAAAVAVDSFGNVVVVGGDKGSKYWVVRLWAAKYADDGALLWSQRHELTGLPARANGVAIDAADNMVVVGTEADRVWVREYSPDGLAMWMDIYDSYPGVDAGYDVALLADGTAFVVGDASAEPAPGWLLLEYAP